MVALSRVQRVHLYSVVAMLAGQWLSRRPYFRTNCALELIPLHGFVLNGIIAFPCSPKIVHGVLLLVEPTLLV